MCQWKTLLKAFKCGKEAFPAFQLGKCDSSTAAVLQQAALMQLGEDPLQLLICHTATILNTLVNLNTVLESNILATRISRTDHLKPRDQCTAAFIASTTGNRSVPEPQLQKA